MLEGLTRQWYGRTTIGGGFGDFLWALRLRRVVQLVLNGEQG